MFIYLQKRLDIYHSWGYNSTITNEPKPYSHRQPCGGAGHWYYIENGNVQGPDTVQFRIAGTLENLKKYLIKECLYSVQDIDTFLHNKEKNLQDSLSELVVVLSELVVDSLSEQDKINLKNLDAINAYTLKDTGLSLVPDKELVRVEIHGYSQGDYAVVWYCPRDLEQAWGSPPDQKQLKEMFEHYFYDLPVYAECKILRSPELTESGAYEERTFWYDDICSNIYDWNKQEFIEYICKETGISPNVLSSVIPNEIDYL